MRIIAGEFRGRNVKSPSEETTRPTTDRVRESMFSSILSRMDMEGAVVLDAFGGSGALGLEALSRGAERCSFWERDAKARDVLQSNITAFGLDSRRASVKQGDVLESSQRPLAFGHPYDLVLLDPPYVLSAQEVCAFLRRLLDHNDIAPGTVVVYEHALQNQAAAVEAVEGEGYLEITGQKKYGKIGVVYLEVKDPVAAAEFEVQGADAQEVEAHD